MKSKSDNPEDDNPQDFGKEFEVKGLVSESDYSKVYLCNLISHFW